jgi:hypothetical protein
MDIKDLQIGNIIKFTYKADKSNDPIQNVELRVDHTTKDHIHGINVSRILDGSQDNLPFRTYKVKNIIPGTIYLRIG